MDPKTKDPVSKERSKGCSASNKQSVMDSVLQSVQWGCKRVWGVGCGAAAPRCGYEPRSVDVNPSTFAIYIFITVYSNSTVFHTVLSTIVLYSVQSCERAGRLAIHDCTLFGTVASMVSFRLPNRSHSDCRIEPHLCDAGILPHRTNRVIPLAAVTA